MSCVIREVDEHTFDPEVLERQLGLALVKDCEGDPQKLLVTVLGFLKRKSNFFKHGDPKRRILEAYNTVAADGEAAAAKTQPAEAPSSSSAPAKAPREVQQQAGAQQDQQQASGAASPAPAAAASSADDAAAAPSTSAPPSPDVVPRPAAEAEDGPDQSKGLKPNAGRGADLERYSWTQTLSEVTVCVPVPPGTKGRGLDVAVTKTRLRVGLKGQPPIIDGKLSEPVRADDCLWNLSDNVVELTLTKAEGMHWWRSVVEGEAPIDTQQVEPENSKLEELDPETRSTVEKMMFDQRQKALGLPTSDEMQKQEMLRKFMAAHPEMDFSGAKIQM